MERHRRRQGRRKDLPGLTRGRPGHSFRNEIQAEAAGAANVRHHVGLLQEPAAGTASAPGIFAAQRIRHVGIRGRVGNDAEERDANEGADAARWDDGHL